MQNKILTHAEWADFLIVAGFEVLNRIIKSGIKKFIGLAQDYIWH